MSLHIQKPGILTTVQDLGRQKYRRFGINPTGAMDGAAAHLINILLDNDENEGVLEMHFPAPEIRFTEQVLAVIGGADFAPTLSDKPVENWRSFVAKKASVLKFTRRAAGNRAYLAIKGGFKVDDWLESKSTNLVAAIGGFNGRKLESGDVIGCGTSQDTSEARVGQRIAPSLIPMYRPFPTIRIIPGAEFDYLSADGLNLLENEDFSISNSSNRMGFRLSGRPLQLSQSLELVSSAVSFGTIQLLPDGQLIVLMADHQTAGGYPRIAHVIGRDLPLLAQLGANDKVAFHLITIDQAENLALEFDRELNFLRVGCKFQANYR
jgi:antagonist of KipI